MSNQLISLHKFTMDAGVSTPTVWRWRRRGWLRTINICGRPYVSQDALVEFRQRAEAGEFSKDPIVPAPPRRG